jgi:hypothetical protein
MKIATNQSLDPAELVSLRPQLSVSGGPRHAGINL